MAKLPTDEQLTVFDRAIAQALREPCAMGGEPAVNWHGSIVLPAPLARRLLETIREVRLVVLNQDQGEVERK